MKTISAAEFKAKCLKIMNDVNTYGEEVIITKHGRPVVKLVGVQEESSKSIFGYMKNSVYIKDDIIKPIDEMWDLVARGYPEKPDH